MISGKPVEDPPDHLFRWLDAVGRAIRDRLVQELRGAGVIPGRQARVLQLIPRSGMRITDLAERARVTKQALGQFVNALQAAGLVESVPDPSDRRVRLVRRTPAGDELNDRITATLARVEAEFRAEVGERRYDTMKEVMRELGGTSW